MSEEIAIEILKQATIETTTGACEKCPRKDKNKTCIGCLDTAREKVLEQLQQKENIVKEVKEYINNHQLVFEMSSKKQIAYWFDMFYKELLEILDKANDREDK